MSGNTATKELTETTTATHFGGVISPLSLPNKGGEKMKSKKERIFEKQNISHRCEDKNCTHYGQPLNKNGICEGRSKRKPYNQDAGYIASRRSGINKGWVVIYNAKDAGLDDSDGKYAVVCQTHNTIVNVTSIPKARSAMKAVDFCEKCQEVRK